MLRWIKKHYVWVIILVMMLQTTIYGGMGNTVASIFKIPVTAELGMPLASFSLASSMRTLILFIAMTCSGPVFKRFGTKIPMVAGLLTLTLAYILLSVSNNFWLLALSFGLTGLGEAFVGTTAISLIVNAWYHRYQGSVLGLITACTGLGGGIFSVLLEAVILQNGWRAARLVSAACLFGAAIILLLLLRNKPENMALRPIGDGYVPKKKEHRRQDDHWEGYSMQEMLRKPTFYLAAVTFFLIGVCIYSAFANIPTLLEDRGMGEYGGLMNGLMLICLAVFKFACGNISDLIGPKKVSFICMGCSALGLWLLTEVTDLPGAIAAIIIYSVSVPMTLVVISLLSYPLFGYRSHDATMGIFLAMPYLGSVVIAPVADAVHDHLHNYDLMFRLSSLLTVVVIGMLLLLFVWTKRDQRKYQKASCSVQDDI